MNPAETYKYMDDLRKNLFAQRRDTGFFNQAKDLALEYMNQLDHRPVYPAEAAIADLAAFDEALADGPQAPADILKQLHLYGSPATVAQTGGRYFGFVCGSSTPAAIAAKWLSDVWDQNPALFVLSPIVAKLEAVCQAWLVDLFALPETTVAGFVSGTSTATLCGLAAGRHALFRRMGWDVNQHGMQGAPNLRVVLGDQVHGTVYKALALLGVGLGHLEHVPTDANGAMDSNRLPQLDKHCLVIAQAGNVNSGSFDPIAEICRKANSAGAWVHIDGAFGLWAAGCAKTRHLTEGIEKADSWSVDAHKTLNVPYDCGIVLCRHAEDLVMAMQLSGSYIQYSDNRDSMMYTPEMSRRARAVELWATLKCFGKNGIDELVEGLCALAVQFAEQLRQAGFRILNRVVFNQVLVACDTPAETQATLKHIQACGECWCGGSLWNNEPAIRISVCSWATTRADVQQSVAAFVECRALAKAK